MLKSIKLINYKTHKNLSISFQDFNILVGPNNSGKSTVLEALRILGGAYRYASRFKPKVLLLESGKIISGYTIPESSIPISIRHVHTDYNEKPTTIHFKFKGNKSIFIEFTSQKEPILYFEGEDKPIKSSVAFRNEFPLNLSIVPVLGPLEENEEIHDIDYVKRWSNSHRAPRLFRNVWYYDKEDFHIFKQVLEETWRGLTIQFPERQSVLSKNISMFCTEDRMEREVFWSGNGFQIWLQLLTHIIKNKSADLIVIDEPEIYLHPDLQRKLINLLRDFGMRVVIATHSIEIINEVEPEDVLILEKNKRHAKRLTDLIELQTAVDILGSTQNIHLTRLAKGKRVLFVEGQDSKFLERFAKILGSSYLFSNGDLTIIPIGGFSQWEKISHAQWAFAGVLGEDIKVAALFDRDYKNKEQVEKFEDKLGSKVDYVHVLKKKEIENYLLIPTVLDKAIKAQMKKRTTNTSNQKEIIPPFDVDQMLSEITDGFKTYVLGQLIEERYNYFKSEGHALSTIAHNLTTEFEKDWENLAFRLEKVPGKEMFSKINLYIQEKWKVSISPSIIFRYITESDIQCEIKEMLQSLNDFVYVDISKKPHLVH